MGPPYPTTVGCWAGPGHAAAYCRAPEPAVVPRASDANVTATLPKKTIQYFRENVNRNVFFYISIIFFVTKVGLLFYQFILDILTLV